MKTDRRHSQAGFSLIELMVTSSIMAVMILGLSSLMQSYTEQTYQMKRNITRKLFEQETATLYSKPAVCDCDFNALTIPSAGYTSVPGLKGYCAATTNEYYSGPAHRLDPTLAIADIRIFDPELISGTSYKAKIDIIYDNIGSSGTTLRPTRLLIFFTSSTVAPNDIINCNVQLQSGAPSLGSWQTTGNSGLDPTINFLGTTDDIDVIFKQNSINSGLLNSQYEQTALGVGALSPTVSNRAHTAIGYRALGNAVGGAGSDYTAIGPRALESVNTATNSTAVGLSALMSLTDGQDNTAVGDSALMLIQNSNSNTSVGEGTMEFLTTSSLNTVIGEGAMADENGVGSNVVMGHDALPIQVTTGGRNTAAGRFALLANSTGNMNVAFGYSTLIDNLTGSGNTAVGAWAFGKNTTGSFNIGIGHGVGDANIAGNDNIAIGYQALRVNQNGSGNVAIGSRANWTAAVVVSDSNDNIAIGNYSGPVDPVTISNSTGIGFLAQTTVSDMVQLGNVSVTTLEKSIIATVNHTSDKRLKSNIEPYPHGLDLILQLNPVTYVLNSHPDSMIQSGFIAQEVERTGVPFYGLSKPKSASGFYSISYTQFVVPLVNAVKELYAEILSVGGHLEQLLAKYTDLEFTVAKQSKEIDELTRMIDELAINKCSDKNRELVR